MSELKFDPGAAKFGNFINYYQFNPPESRISLMPSNFLHLTKVKELKTILCLDVGCNTGKLTQALYNYMINLHEDDSLNLRDESNQQVEVFICGIDFDNILIERANESNDNKNVTFLCLDIMKDNCSDVLESYLKQYNKNCFDIVFTFSITMWIHLNYGDDGLKEFLTNISKCSNSIVVEPQPWKCYRNAVRRMKRSNGEEFSNFKQLKIRNSVELEISNYLTNVCNYEKVFDTTETKWDRIISIYNKIVLKPNS